ncbi:MAG TPA: CvpA family protein [Firmicutes bacterium]|nr:CvpA family protein [Bacillota bacterium]
MTWSSILLDIAVVLLLLGGIFKGKHDGFLKSLILFLGGVASLLIAGFLSGWLADWIYDSFLRERIAASVLGAMQQNGAQQLTDSLQGILAALGGMLGMVAQAFDLSSLQLSAEQIASALDGNLSELSGVLTDQVFGPPVRGLVAAIAFVILFSLCLLVFRLIGRSLQAVNRVPIVGGINRLLGMVFGFFNAAFWLVVLSFVFSLLLMLFGSQDGFLSQQTVDSSWLFGWIYHHNPLIQA